MHAVYVHVDGCGVLKFSSFHSNMGLSYMYTVSQRFVASFSGGRKEKSQIKTHCSEPKQFLHGC